jgi:hypothetical protein
MEKLSIEELQAEYDAACKILSETRKRVINLSGKIRRAKASAIVQPEDVKRKK